MKWNVISGSSHPDYPNEKEHGSGYRGWIKTPRGTEQIVATYQDINDACRRGTPYDRTDAKTGIRTYYLVEEAP